MQKCEICGNDTNSNFGKPDQVICQNCAAENSTTKTRNVMANIIFFFAFLLLGVTLIGTIWAIVSLRLYDAVYITTGGIVLSLILFGIAEIIIQLTNLNSKFDK